MAPKVTVLENGSVHLVVDEQTRRCECGIDTNGQARSCEEILQDMVDRHFHEYTAGRVPTTKEEIPMSWSINIIGKAADVLAVIDANPCLPHSLKALVAEFAAAGSGSNSYSPQPGAIQIISSGHYDANDGNSNIYSFSLNPV